MGSNNSRLKPTLYTGLVLEAESCACGARQVPMFEWAVAYKCAPIVLRDSSTGKIVKCRACNGGKPVA